MSKNGAPKTGAKGFPLSVLPSREALDKAIDDNGFCHPKKCWHKVAISALMERLEPGGHHHVRVDAGHIKLNYRGWRYIADTPRHVKRSLMLFDLKRYDEVYIRQYVLRFRRTTKIIPTTPERQEQINVARHKRIAKQVIELGAAGSERKRGYADMSMRIKGFSGVV